MLVIVTIKDIAKFTGVSPTTVSNVIHGRDGKVSPETKIKVRDALKELNYTANMGGRLLANHGSRIIGVIIQDSDAVIENYFDNPYHGELIQALESKIKLADYFLMFHRVSTFEEGAKLAEMWNLEGLIVSGAASVDILSWQKRVSVPIVFVDSYTQNKEPTFLNVGVEDRKGAYEMTQYLLKMGHKKIMFLAKGSNPLEWKGVDFERGEGVKEAMQEWNLMPNFIAVPSTYKNYQSFISTILVEKIKDNTAIFCSSDLLAVQINSELFKKGIRIPEDVSIVSFDGTPYSKYATPQITSMHQDISEKAAVIIKLMMEAIQSHNTLSKSKAIKASLIIGESVNKI